MCLTNLFTDIADAIRSKKGTTDGIIAENFPSEILSIETSGGETTTSEGAKIFKTIEEMNSSSNNSEGDYAVVIGDSYKGVEQTSAITSLKFPETVVLDSAQTSTNNGIFQDDSGTRYRIYVTSTQAYFMNYTTYEYIARYTSSDGITYTRTTDLETYEFESPIRYITNTWYDVFSKFLVCRGKAFLGLYDYQKVNVENTLFCSNFDNKDNPRCFLLDFKNNELPEELADTSDNENGLYHYRTYFIYESEFLYTTNTGIDVYKPTKYKVLFFNYTNTASQRSFLFQYYKYNNDFMVAGYINTSSATSSKPCVGLSILSFENGVETITHYTESQMANLLKTAVHNSSWTYKLFSEIDFDNTTYMFETAGYGKSVSIRNNSTLASASGGVTILTIDTLPATEYSSYTGMIQSATNATKLGFVPTNINNLDATENDILKDKVAYTNTGIVVGVANSSEQLENQLAEIETQTATQTEIVETQTTSLNELSDLVDSKLV